MERLNPLLGKIHNCDCLDFMATFPNECVNMFLTDPPYNMAYSGRGKKDFTPLTNDDLTPEKHSEWLRKILVEMQRTAAKDAHIYIWVDWRNYPRFYALVSEYFEIKNCLVWDKKNFGMGQNFRYQHEFCIYATKGNPELYFEKKNIPNIIYASKDTVSEYVHPTQKPTYLMEMLIRWSTRDGDIVCDPFLGSGTTAVAAEGLSRKWLGCEIMEEYFIEATKRINAERAQLKLF